MDTSMLLALVALQFTSSRKGGDNSSAQAVLGTSNSIPWAGRLALVLSAQRQQQRDRDIERQKLGTELGQLVTSNRLTAEDFNDRPNLGKLASPFLPATALQPAPHN